MGSTKLNREEEMLKYLDSYLDSKEYRSMRSNLDIILDNTVILAEELFPNKKTEQALMAADFIGSGYLSPTGTYSKNNGENSIGLCRDLIFELGLTPFTGEGCCRNNSALLKLILDRLEIENEIVTVDNSRRDEDIASIRMFLSEFHKKSLFVNHTVNYVSIGNKDLFLEVSYDHGYSGVFYNDNGFLTPVLDQIGIDNRAFFYNYSYFFNGRKPLSKVAPLSIKKQLEVASKHDDTILTIGENIKLVSNFRMQNYDYMEKIKEDYQKVLVKERKLGIK